jgi:2-polyprenyl-3-methyl-5-hydroxy-6-metoxy-1,4-benzoquinol methylase
VRQQRVSAYFDTRAAAYQRKSERGLWHYARQCEVTRVFEFLGPVSGKHVLDLGSGSGYYTRRLLNLNAATVTALDVSERMIRNLPNDPRVRRILGDAATADADVRFDQIVCAGLLEFVAEPEAVLANARNMARKDTVMVCLVPTTTVGGRIYRRYHRGHGCEVTLFSEGSFRTRAEGARWRVTGGRRATPYAHVYRLVAHGLCLMCCF